ncbi:MAG TPA: glycosyltransferase [Thermoanaerobaculia bacterium]|nr:glycosyltransferase [Thermoanaerobaculia bacterium]
MSPDSFSAKVLESSSPMFSVVIPTFNREKKVAKAVRSVLAQTFTDFEIVVVDDGSDETARQLQDEFGDRVRYFRGLGQRVAGARNLAIGHALGEWIAFLDSDDWWYPTKLERYAEAARAHPEIGLFYSMMDMVDDRGRYIRTLPIRTRRDVYPAVLEGNFIFNSTVAVKRECLSRVGLFDTKLIGCEDWELFVRVTREFPALLIDESLVAYEHSSSGSLSSNHEVWVAAHDEVIAKCLAADTTLSSAWVQRIHAGGHYVQARIYLGAGDECHALENFRAAFRQNRRRWRAFVYMILLSWKPSRMILSRRAKVWLRLPEAR